MHTFVAIIGSRNSGKSTIIKSLTGCPTGQFRDTVGDAATGRSIFVVGSSPQEVALPLLKLRKILKQAANDPLCNGVVIALQPTFPSKRLSMEQVFSEATAHNFTVFAYVLDPEHSGASGQTAGVNFRLAHIGVKARVLDARRFAHINAAAINARAKIAS